jgi:uncharacterized protein YggU (UPF0235/DUF167 family)
VAPVARLAVRVQPRAKADALVARVAGVPKSAVRVVHGAGTRDKVLESRGLDTASLRRAVGLDA